MTNIYFQVVAIIFEKRLTYGIYTIYSHQSEQKSQAQAERVIFTSVTNSRGKLPHSGMAYRVKYSTTIDNTRHLCVQIIDKYIY